VTKRQQWPRGRNGDLPDWYGPDLPFVERTIFELLREENEMNANYGVGWIPAEPEEPDKLKSALISADFRDITPLRVLYPEISEYINLPELSMSRLSRLRKYARTNPVERAANTARGIYAIWQRDYGMKKRSRSRGQSTAVDVAAAYSELFGPPVSVGAVERKLWHHGRGRK